jgi:hypothetical protein
MPQYLSAPLLALALVLVFEGAAAAKTQAAEHATIREQSASAAQTASQDAAPATVAARLASDRDLVVLANSALAMRIRICHISRHPRDGVPAEEHACPLLIADATQAVIVPSVLPSKTEPVRLD